jgi:hypothetical protein
MTPANIINAEGWPPPARNKAAYSQAARKRIAATTTAKIQPPAITAAIPKGRATTVNKTR